MCNQEEKCKAMQNSVLRFLTKELKEAKEKGKIRTCRMIINQIDEEISTYECKPANKIKARIKAFQNEEIYPNRMRIIDLLVLEIGGFIEE